MNRKSKIAVFFLLLLGVMVLVGVVAYGSNIAVLNPKGTVAGHQRDLMIFGVLLSILIVVPVYIMTFVIAWKYRAGNKKARYSPNWDRSKIAETIWWLVPLALILLLSIVTWKSSHDLDPSKPVASTAKSLKIQVVALQWKWLFIYPDQNIASVNFVQLPVDRPIDFEITSDAPMNSFWIPQLGGQIYAMSGMTTHLHLMADEAGEYNGSSANISGAGFAGMRFVARASSQADFDKWVQGVQQQPDSLTAEAYHVLAQPSKDNPRTFYSSVLPDLYDTIIMQYMEPGHEMSMPAPVHDHGDTH